MKDWSHVLYCSKCGKGTPSGVKVCVHCGALLEPPADLPVPIERVTGRLRSPRFYVPFTGPARFAHAEGVLDVGEGVRELALRVEVCALMVRRTRFGGETVVATAVSIADEAGAEHVTHFLLTDDDFEEFLLNHGGYAPGALGEADLFPISTLPYSTTPLLPRVLLRWGGYEPRHMDLGCPRVKIPYRMASPGDRTANCLVTLMGSIMIDVRIDFLDQRTEDPFHPPDIMTSQSSWTRLLVTYHGVLGVVPPEPLWTFRICVPMDPADLLWRNRVAPGWERFGEGRAEPAWKRSTVPLPVIFERAGSRAPPQPGVVLRREHE